MEHFRKFWILLPLVSLLACNNGQHKQARQESIQDSIEQVRNDSLEQVRQDSIEKVVINEKIAFLKDFIAKFDYGEDPDDIVLKNLRSKAYDQLDPMKGDPEEEGYYDIDYFLDGYISLTSHDVRRVESPNISHVNGNWFRISSKLYDAMMPYPDQRYRNASYQVMVEDVDGRYMITKLDLK